jgi:hypothetical protein
LGRAAEGFHVPHVRRACLIIQSIKRSRNTEATNLVTKSKRRARVKQICDALPEVSSRDDQHIGFQVRGRTFAYYLDDHHGDGRVALCCKLPVGDQDALVALHPERFFVPAYLGSRGWVGLRLDLREIDWGEVRKLVLCSYQLIAPKRLATLAGS